MGRTKQGQCTQPHERRGRPKEEGSSNRKYTHANRHKRRQKKEEEAASGLEDGRRFVGNIPSCYVLQKLGMLDDEKKAIECLSKKGIIDIPCACYGCRSNIKPEFNRNRVRCDKVNCQFTPPPAREACNGPMSKTPPGMTAEEAVNSTRHCADQEECGWTWDPGQAFLHSFFKGTLFHGSGLPANRVVFLLWLWCMRVSASRAAMIIGIKPETAGEYFRLLRQIVVEMLLSQGCCDSQAGGEGIIVEIDESKFGKRKYNGGRRVKGDWVLGMVERTKERRMVLVVVPSRTAETLEAIIDRFVAPGDMWKGHDKLTEMKDKGFDHKRLCHKCEFVSKDGIHTQTIEGNWTAVKRMVPVAMRSGHDLQEFLFEFMWRRQNAGNLWEGLMVGLSRVRFTERMLKKAQEERDVRCEEEDDSWELPRNCRPRDVRFDCDSDVDGDDEAIATGVLSSMMMEEMAALKRHGRAKRESVTRSEPI